MRIRVGIAQLKAEVLAVAADGPAVHDLHAAAEERGLRVPLAEGGHLGVQAYLRSAQGAQGQRRVNIDWRVHVHARQRFLRLPLELLLELSQLLVAGCEARRRAVAAEPLQQLRAAP